MLLVVLLLLDLDVPGGLVGVGLSLLDQVGDGLLEVVDARAHLVYARDDVVGHRLEPRLHLSQHLLHQLSQLVCVVGRVCTTAYHHVVIVAHYF